MYEYFGVTGTHESILDFTDLMGTTFRGDDVLGFDTRSDEVLLSIHEMLPDGIVESLRKCGFASLINSRQCVGVYDLNIFQKDMPPSYPRLKTTVQNFLNQKVRARNFEAFQNLNQKWNR